MEAYFRDKETRYKKGEYFTMDSIQMPDSLKYYTNIKKRMVYGGGGILPDIFVPLDTADNTDYLADLIRTGVNNEWALTYTDKNRESLLAKFPTSDNFVTSFELGESELQDMIKMAESEKVAFVEEDFKRSEETIKIRTKALIARNLYDNEAFYKVINHLNPALKKALDTLNDGTFDAMNLGDEADIAKINKTKSKTKK